MQYSLNRTIRITDIQYNPTYFAKFDVLSVGESICGAVLLATDHKLE